YDSNWGIIDNLTTGSSGSVLWNDIPTETYNFEAYTTFQSSLWGACFWGGTQATVSTGTVNATIQQSEPFIETITINDNAFVPGSSVHIDVEVKNNTLETRTCQVEIRIDQNQSATWDYESGFHGPVIINPEELGYFGFDWNIPLGTDAGTYYITARVQSEVSSTYINTDATGWDNSFLIESSQNTISFANETWNVKNGSGLGPGVNDWSNSTNSVWADQEGLHLKIRKIGEEWYCAEVSTENTFGYGTYTFQLDSRVELNGRIGQLDPNVLLGLFTYQSNGVNTTPQEYEIDMEFSSWKDLILPNNSWHVFQYREAGDENNPNLITPQRYQTSLGGDYSTHQFQWSNNEIRFNSYHGHYYSVPYPRENYLIADTIYNDSRVPPEANEKVHINFWLVQGLDPMDDNEAEIIISDFKFTHPPVLSHDTQTQFNQNGRDNTIEVTYTDSDNNAADLRELHVINSSTGEEISGSPFTMISTGGTPITGETFSYTVTNLATGNYEYKFYFTDGEGGRYQEPEGFGHPFVVTPPVAPAIRIDQDPVDFGSVQVGNSSIVELTIYNDGNDPLEIFNTTTINNPQFTINTTLPITILAVNSSTIQLQFTPSSAGNHSAILTIDNNDPDENPYNVSLTGNGILYGTTIITHGFQAGGSLPYPGGWLEDMAQAIRSRAILGKVMLYNKATGEFDIQPNSDQNGETILIFDWAIESDDDFSGFSEAAGDALFSSLMGGELNGDFSLDHLHFIGHSRGCVVNSEAIERLRAIGKPVEHVTNLDAHDWGALGITHDDFDVNYPLEINEPVATQPNRGVVSWDGVMWSDSYWQNSVATLDGRAVYGTNSVYLGTIGHSNVHEWYLGTIDHSSGDPSWFGGSYPTRIEGGYNLSRIGGNIQNRGIIWGSQNPVLHNNSIDGIVIGDFDRGPAALWHRFPGWSEHGGDGNGHFDSGHLELDWSSEWRRHNRFYIPTNAEKIWFQYKINNASVGSAPNTDKLQILIGSSIINPIEGDIWLNNTTQNFIYGSIDISSYTNTVITITFQIVPDGIVDSEIWIDNVAFELDSSLPTRPFTPVASLPFDEDIITTLFPSLEWSPFQHGGDGNTQAGYQLRVRKDSEELWHFYEPTNWNVLPLNWSDESNNTQSEKYRVENFNGKSTLHIKTEGGTNNRIKAYTNMSFGVGTYEWKVYIPPVNEPGASSGIGAFLLDRTSIEPQPREIDFEIGYGKSDVRQIYGIEGDDTKLLCYMTAHDNAYSTSSDIIVVDADSWYCLRLILTTNEQGNYLAYWRLKNENDAQFIEGRSGHHFTFGPQDNIEFNMYCSVETFTNLWIGDINPQFVKEAYFDYVSFGDIIIYDTGFIQDISNNTHIYSPGSYNGVDPITGETRVSDPLQWGNHYHWHIRYQDSGGDWSEWSADDPNPHQDFYTNSMPVVSAVSPTSGYYKDDISLSATSSDPDVGENIISERYEYSLEGSTWNTISGEDTTPDDDFNWTSGLNESSVWIRAQAYDGDLWGDWSNSVGPIMIDNTAPISGTISINNDAVSTSSFMVNLYNLSANDPISGLSQMQFSNNINGPWSNPETYSNSKANWDLSTYGGNTNEGIKTVYVKYNDLVDNISNSFSDDIEYIISSNNSPVLSWTDELYYETDGVDPDTSLPLSAFTFHVEYSDADGDAPNTGFPRLSIFDNGTIVGSERIINEFNSGDFTTGRIYTIDASDLVAGTNYTYLFEAEDLNGAVAIGEAAVEVDGPVVNTPPVVSNVSISPVTPQTTDDLTLTYTFSDADGITESGTEIKWYRNGSEITGQNILTLLSSETNDGDEIYATVKPSDGIQFGLLATSPIVSVTSSTPGLIASFPFNGNAIDETGNGHDGVVTGPLLTNDRFGNSNSAYSLDGSDDFINIGNQLKPNFPISVSAWIKVNSLDDTGVIFGNDEWDGSDRYYGIQFRYTSTGQLFAAIGNGGIAAPSARFDRLTSDVLITDNNWHHVVAIYNDYNEIQIYFDNIEYTTIAGTGTGTGLDYSTADGLLGARFSGGSTISVINGDFDDIRVYNTALSVQEINDLFTPGNRAPELAWTQETGYETDGVNPDTGLPLSTFTFHIKYSDADGDAPNTGYPRVSIYDNATIVGSPHVMSEFDSNPITTGRIYTVNVPDLTAGTNYTYLFEAQDANGTAVTGDGTVEQDGPIVNTPPVVSNVLISPSNPVPDDDIIFNYDYSDADVDVESGTEIKWYRNGTEISGQTTTTLPSTETSDGDEIYASVRPNDGIEFGDLVSSATVTISSTSQELLAYYQFEGDASDASGNGYTGTLIGGATISDHLSIGHNASDALELPHTMVDGLSDYTFMAMLRIDNVLNNHVYTWFNCVSSSQPNSLMLGYNNDNNPDHWLMAVNSTGTHFDLNAAIEDLNWHHVTVTKEGTIARLYIDGVQVGSDITVPDEAISVDAGGFIIGQDQDGVGVFLQDTECWAGDIDELRIYNYSLSTQEIINIYNTPPVASDVAIDPLYPGVETDLTLNYTYNDPDGHAESGSDIKWYRNGSEIVGQTSLTLPSTETSEGDLIYATIRPNDGFTFGTLEQSQTVTISNQLVIQYQFDGDATDATGHGFDGTPTAGVSYGTDEKGNANSAVIFDAQGDVIDISQTALPPPFTVSSWIYKQANKRSQPLLQDPDYGLKIEQSPDLHTVGFTRFGDTDYSFNHEIPLNTWQHVVWVFSETQTDLYIDGVYQDSESATIHCPLGTINIDNTYFFEGYLNDLRVYNYNLSAPEIKAIHNTPPVISNLNIVPRNPGVENNLYLEYDYSDNENQPESGTEYTWYKNGSVIVGQTLSELPLSETLDGDVIYVIVHPNDGISFGDPVQSNPVTISNSLIAYYQFEGDVSDASGNGHTGTLLGGATITDHLSIGQNNTDALELPHTIMNGVGDFTISANLRLADVYSNHAYVWITCATNSEIDRIQIVYSNSSVPDLWTGRINSDQFIFEINNIMENLNWHHVVFQREGDIGRIFIDSDYFVSYTTVNDQPILVDAGGFIVGQHQDALGVFNNSNESWAGDVDELRIYNYALTAQEIQLLYNTPPTVTNVALAPNYPGVETEITLGYTFSDTDGDTESDSEIKWYRNGTEITGQTTTTLPSSETSERDAIYATIRPSDGITFGDLVQSQTATVSNQLVVYYPFDGDANDASGNGINGQIFGDITDVTDRFGSTNSAYSFDGNGDYMLIDKSDLPTPYSVSLWYNKQGNQAAQYLLAGE
ncbi:MAG: choice-of-anchor D domain-containing protein, partial [Gammaproteobacteria bacterium]|nr:choice-of-anchor D domain-containing protein [Gammaproteobacteria bacterium]